MITRFSTETSSLPISCTTQVHSAVFLSILVLPRGKGLMPSLVFAMSPERSESIAKQIQSGRRMLRLLKQDILNLTPDHRDVPIVPEPEVSVLLRFSSSARSRLHPLISGLQALFFLPFCL